MANERVTEELVRGWLRDAGYYTDPNCWVDEQRPRSQAVASLLKTAGKRGHGGIGSPEFIITTPAMPDLVFIVECKAETKKHESIGLDRPADYAVDGVLHYAKFLVESSRLLHWPYPVTHSTIEYHAFFMLKGHQR